MTSIAQKIILLVALPLFFTGTIKGQCPSSFNASIQEHLLAFIAQYPDCEHITGHVTISGTVSDLSPLAQIKTIGGSLNILNNTGLTSLSGLESLTSTHGMLIEGNTTLTSLDGLSDLAVVDGWMQIKDCPALASIQGLSSLAEVSGRVFLTKLNALQSLSGLNGLTSVGESVHIVDMPVLQSLEGLENLHTVAKDISICGSFTLFGDGAPNLTSVSGLSGLMEVGGGLEINNCTKLAVIDGIDELTSAGGLVIVNNPILTSINGFAKLATLATAVNYNGIYINDNPELEVVLGTQMLRTTEFLRIQGPKIDHIALDNLENVGQDFRIDALSLTSLSGPDQLATVGRSVILSTGLQEISGFNNLESIGGMLLIDSRESLKRLSGFNNLENIGIGQLGWGLDIYQHDQLTAITGLTNLKNVDGDVVITENDNLVSVEGLRNLRTVGGLVAVRLNASLNDCSPLCPFLQDGTAVESINIDFNGDAFGACWTMAAVEKRCSYTMSLIDVNPKFFPPEFKEIADVKDLSAEQLASLSTLRDAVCADGVSAILLKFEMPAPGRIEFNEIVEGLSMPWGDMTYTIDKQHFFYAHYLPPETFEPGEEATFTFQDEILALYKSIAFDVVDMDDGRTSLSFSITVTRPPVILIHGTYSTPDKWKQAASMAGSVSMYDALMDNDYKSFLLDYTTQNGSSNSTECDFGDISRVLWENPGGIEEALDYYRNTLNVAVTQVDVVGHSLGGIIPRIYASEHFNADHFKRRDNFMEGDLNRIITIGATHFGSHLAEFQYFLENAISILDVGPLEWIQASTLTYLTASWLGAPLSEAVRDQLPAPMGESLALLGETKVPAHAIAMSAPPGNLKAPEFDPIEEYYDMYWYITMLLQMNDDVLEQYLNYKVSLKGMGLQASTTLDGGNPTELFPGYNDLVLFKTMIEDGIKLTGQVISVMDGTFAIPSKAEILKWTLAETGMSDLVNLDPLIDVFIGGADPAGVALNYFSSRLTPDGESVLNKYLSVHDQSMEAVRSLIFNNDENDGVVRVQSQTGELESHCANCITRFENHLHGAALTYPDLQDRVVALLDGGMADFHEDGFPASDHGQKLYYPSDALGLYSVPRMGPPAICQSGMVPEHAQAFARVADQENVVLIVRPVNPDATPLISRGAATKKMDVKPKSSNWGPQRGYLPAEQRYSKLWKAFEGSKRDEQIAKYNARSKDNLMKGVTIARHLQVKTCDDYYWVFIDSSQLLMQGDLSAENEIVLVPVRDQTKVCYWGDNFSTEMIITDCEDREPDDRFGPLYVMASPDVMEDDGTTGRYLTADYDLLMIGFHKGDDNPHNPPTDIDFRDGVGQITAEQEALLEKLNASVRATGYSGGNVAHHGPENQFDASPYIDYPLTVFMPDDIPNGFLFGGSDGQVLSIDMGEPGFRDINLKHFVNEMRTEGFDLYTNVKAPGWRWTWDEGREAYQLEDHKELPSYVESLPFKRCDKLGYESGEICDPVIRPVKPTVTPSQESWFGVGRHAFFDWSVSPNPVIDDLLVVNISGEANQMIEFHVADALGQPRYAVAYELDRGENAVTISVSDLEPGIYTIQTSDTRPLRFVKL